MSVPGAAQARSQPQPPPYSQQQPSERCPLCGAALHERQDWCLSCGAAARTRLAATPRWWMPVLVLAAVAVVAIGVIVASLVKLAG